MSKKGFTSLKAVDSKALKFISYHADDQVLLVRYSSGENWYYDNVPKHVYQELLACNKNERASVGKVFISLVRNHPDRPGRKVVF